MKQSTGSTPSTRRIALNKNIGFETSCWRKIRTTPCLNKALSKSKKPPSRSPISLKFAGSSKAEGIPSILTQYRTCRIRTVVIGMIPSVFKDHRSFIKTPCSTAKHLLLITERFKGKKKMLPFLLNLDLFLQNPYPLEVTLDQRGIRGFLVENLSQLKTL